MLFDPTYTTRADEMYAERAYRNASMYALHSAGMSHSGGYHPIGALVFFDELERLVKKTGLKRLILRLLGKNPEAIALRERMEEVLGVNLPMEPELIIAMMDEVRRYKWLEAERVGRDIWRERNPRDPESSALREWFQRHFGAWYLARRPALGNGK